MRLAGFSLIAACALGLLLAAPARAVDLSGTWASDPAACSTALERSAHGIGMEQKGFYIVTRESIKGETTRCRIKGQKQDGNFVHVQVDCPTDAAQTEFTLRIDGPDKVTRIIPGMPKQNTTYTRCPEP